MQVQVWQEHDQKHGSKTLIFEAPHNPTGKNLLTAIEDVLKNGKLLTLTQEVRAQLEQIISQLPG